MASYHLRVKTSSKKHQKDTNSLEHLDYIARKGKYKKIEQNEIRQMDENYIQSDVWNREFPDISTLLYRSGFGDIYLSPKGIQVTDDANIQTIYLALELAKEIFAGEISLNGNQKFLAKTVIAAAQGELNLSFKEQHIQNFYQKEQEKYGQLRSLGERDKRNNFTDYDSIFQQYTERDSSTIFSEPSITSPGNDLSILSSSSMDAGKLQADMYMQRNADENSLPYRGKEIHSELRPLLSDSTTTRKSTQFIIPEYRKRSLKEAARRIIYKIDNELNVEDAISHLEYINREKAFKKRGGCLYTGHHLPKWAKNDPHIFFKELEINERRNANIYKELELNLPNELTFEQQMEIINEFLEMHFKNHYYTFAFHQKIGNLSEGILHPHVHLMFCEREIDDYEREHERPPEQFPRRHNPKHPEKGGCGKPAHWSGKYHQKVKHLIKIRKDFADIQNKILKKYGHNVTVDERTLFAQRIEALAKGDYEKAEELNRPAEQTIPLAKALNENSPEVKALKKFRKNRAEIKKNQNAVKFFKNQIEINDMEIMINQSMGNLSDLKNKFNKDFNEIAEELAKYKELIKDKKSHVPDLLMEKADPEIKKTWENIKKLAANKRANLEIINDIDYINLHDVALADNTKINQKIAELAKIVRPYFQKQNHINNFSEFNQANSKLIESKNKIIYLKDKLQEKHKNLLLDNGESIINDSKTVSFNDLLQFISKELEKKQQEIIDAENQNDEYSKAKISEKRAYVMAQNKYSKGLLKKINTDIQDQKKLQKKIQALKERRDRTLVHSEQMKIVNAITKMQQSFKEKNIEIERDKATFQKMCSTDNAKAKINQIMLGIIRANKKQLQKMAASGTKIADLHKEKETLSSQQKKLNSLKGQYTGKSKFALTDFNNSHFAHYPTPVRNEKGIIDALCGDVVAAALTMHIEEEHKDWRFLSVFERERLINKL